MNWNQTGMPTALVSRLGQKREVAEFKSVLNDAQNQVMQSVDVEAMAQELAESGGREFVEMVRGLTTALTDAKRDLENANRRYERLVSDLKRRGVRITEGDPPRRKADRPQAEQAKPPSAESESKADGLSEWEEWDRRFRSLLD